MGDFAHDLAGAADNDISFAYIFQFADVPGPAILHERAYDDGVEGVDGAVVEG